THIAMPGRATEVNHIFEDSQKRLWVGCEQGAYHREPGSKWRALTEVHPRGAHDKKRVERFAEDRLGDIWVAAYSGVYCFRRNGAVERHDLAAQPNLNNSPIPIIKDANGRVYVGTERGLVRFIRPDPARPAILDRVWSTKDGLPSLYVSALSFWKG